MCIYVYIYIYTHAHIHTHTPIQTPISRPLRQYPAPPWSACCGFWLPRSHAYQQTKAVRRKTNKQANNKKQTTRGSGSRRMLSTRELANTKPATMIADSRVNAEMQDRGARKGDCKLSFQVRRK